MKLITQSVTCHFGLPSALETTSCGKKFRSSREVHVRRPPIVHDKVLELIPQQDLGREDGQAVIDMIPGYHDFGYLLSRYRLQYPFIFIDMLTLF